MWPGLLPGLERVGVEVRGGDLEQTDILKETRKILQVLNTPKLVSRPCRRAQPSETDTRAFSRDSFGSCL
jgi:hypothetical protein